MKFEFGSQTQKNLTMEEKQKRVVQSIANHVPKHNNGPRTPQERPMVLPGGRKWRNAKDAYNEEFIAEIISSQAELIMGSTLGYKFRQNLVAFTIICHLFFKLHRSFFIAFCRKYESPLLGYDDRYIQAIFIHFIFPIIAHIVSFIVVSVLTMTGTNNNNNNSHHCRWFNNCNRFFQGEFSKIQETRERSFKFGPK